MRDDAQRTSDRILGADGVRALAALGVIFSHLYQRLAQPVQTDWYQDVQAVFMHGAYGVSTFFVLSGMLLSYPFWKAYLTGAERPSLWHYARRRAARIVPAYWASLLVSFGVSFLMFPELPNRVVRLIAGLTFTSGFNWATFFPVETNGPLWSISFEVFSYLLLPLALAGLFGWRRLRIARSPLGSRPRGGAWLAAGYWVAVLGIITAINGFLVNAITLSDEGKGWEYGNVGGAKFWMPGYNPFGFFGHFAIGMLAALLIAAWRTRKAADAVVAGEQAAGGEASAALASARPLARWWWDLVAVAALVGAAVLIWKGREPADPQHLEGFQHQPYGFPVFALLMAALLIGLAHSRWLGRAFDNRFMRYTATVSFGLYVWHYLVLHWISLISGKRFEYGGILDWREHLWMSGAVLVLSYAIATVSWKFLERPVLQSRWATKR